MCIQKTLYVYLGVFLGFFGAQNKCFERILEKYIGADSNLEGPELQAEKFGLNW